MLCAFPIACQGIRGGEQKLSYSFGFGVRIIKENGGIEIDIALGRHLTNLVKLFAHDGCDVTFCPGIALVVEFLSFNESISLQQQGAMMITLFSCQEMPVIHLHLPVIAECILNVPKGFSPAIKPSSMISKDHQSARNTGTLESMNFAGNVNVGRLDTQ